MLLGTPTPESTKLYATTVSQGDPSWAGVLADRIDRRKLLLMSQALLATSAFVFALVVASGQVQIWHAFAYITVSGIAHSVLQPVRSALVANTVPKEDLTNAFALHAMTITSSRLIWPAIGGILVGAFGFTVNFFVEIVAGNS